MSVNTLQRVDLDTPRFTALPPLALYIHVPWCLRKCPYCDFNSHALRGELPEETYLAALVADLEQSLPRVWGRTVYSVFMGGGTPSLLSPDVVDRLLAAVRARLPLAVGAEITLEANPGTFEAERFAAYRVAGVNRLSLGVQSLNPRHLSALGRVHGVDEARRAIACAQDLFDNWNADLMYALPGQSVEEACADMTALLAYRPPHVSAYHLTVEPNTYFHRYPPALPDEDAAAAMQDALEALLARERYEHYEISAFAQPGRACRHNLNYWRFGDYLGIGAGAHSKLSFPDRIVREMRYRQPQQYEAQASSGDAVQQRRDVQPADAGLEFMMNALRLTDGIEVAAFAERTGLPITVVSRPLEDAERRGLVVRDHARFAPTALGRRYLNDLLALFVP